MTKMESESSYRPRYHPVCCELVYGPTRLPPPPHEATPHTFPRATTTRFRLNLLVTDGSGDSLYFAYSRSHVARYRIRRSDGIQLEALPATTIHPPTVINNMRVAHFAPHRGGDLLLMTGGSELTAESGTLSVMPLPHYAAYSERRNKRIRRGRSPPNISAVRAHTFALPVRSAWGLAVHDETCRIAVSSNSHSVLLLSITTSNTFVNVADSGGITGPNAQTGTGRGTVGRGAGTVPAYTGANNVNNNNVHRDNNIDETVLNARNDDDEDDESEDDYESKDGDFERRFRLVPVSDVLDGTHRNNIPCVAFNARGDRLASASIDTTFAVYDLSPSSDPLDMIMDLFVPRVSGRMLFQNSFPLCASRDGRTTDERMWGVHWTSREGLPVLVTAHADSSTIERFYIQQVHNMWWVPSETIDGDESVNDNDMPKAIFHPPDEIVNEIRNPLSSGRHIVLYDDNNDFDMYKQHVSSPEIERIQINNSNNNRERAASNEHFKEGFTFFPESAKRTGWRKQTKKGRDDGFLLVALESKLRLYSIRENPNEEETDCGENEGAEGEKKGLGLLVDELNLYWAMRSNGSNSVMFTNMIEIEKLRAFVLTGVGGGVFLVRIVDVDTDTDVENKASQRKRGNQDDERALQIEALGGPQLFVERVFTTELNVIGTCVVERKSKYRSLRSFELWILEQDGKIQCWDLCERPCALDPCDLV